MKKYFVFFLFLSVSASAQEMSVDEAINTGLNNNPQIQAANIQVEQSLELKRSAFDLGKFSAILMYGQFNSVYNDNNLTFTQNIPFPSVLARSMKLGSERVEGERRMLLSEKQSLVFQIKNSYEHLLYLNAVKNLLTGQDSIYSDFYRAASLRQKAGEGTPLETTTAQVQWEELKNTIRQNEADGRIEKSRLYALTKSKTPFSVKGQLVRKEAPMDTSSSDNAMKQWWQQQTVIARQTKKVERSRLLPDINLGYFNQTLVGTYSIDGKTEGYNPPSKRLQGIHVGLSFPLWARPQIARARAAAKEEEKMEKQVESFETFLTASIHQAQDEIEKNKSTLDYYENQALKNAALLVKQAHTYYRQGEIGYVEYLQAIRNSYLLRSNHLAALYQYNLSVIKIEFLLGKN